ncbi:probable F-box protein At3g61730 [Tripterygium wilfordii]|uniref:probable F-box protein At3g61730 n=1 Tax=Tripterygium wilfordii TaxID=458696 RepID=UPI0018F81B47|nr:probable F-box protein At3g61730 [Tripterygium wilfordii]
MRKRIRRNNSIKSCTSPRRSFPTCHSFDWFEEDLWTEIAKFLDGKSLVMLATTNKWFNSLIMQDSVWRYACLRDLQIPAPCHVEFKWSKLYASAFNCSHAYTFRQQEKHIDWMRIGAFSLNSRAAFLTKNLNGPLKISKEKTKEKMLEFCGSCVLENMKTGIWIADLQLVRCPVCDLNACDGTMQTLDARHIELFLKEGYQDGSWEYNLMGSHKIEKNVGEASAAIFDVKHLKDSSTAAIFDLKSWAGKPNDWQPKSLITFNAVAITTNLQENEGVLVKYHTMSAGEEGEVVSIRISHQLL